MKAIRIVITLILLSVVVYGIIENSPRKGPGVTKSFAVDSFLGHWQMKTEKISTYGISEVTFDDVDADQHRFTIGFIAIAALLAFRIVIDWIIRYQSIRQYKKDGKTTELNNTVYRFKESLKEKRFLRAEVVIPFMALLTFLSATPGNWLFMASIIFWFVIVFPIMFLLRQFGGEELLARIDRKILGKVKRKK